MYAVNKLLPCSAVRYAYSRCFQGAYVKSIPLKVHHNWDSTYPSYSDMAFEPLSSTNKIPFIGVPYNVGSSSRHPNNSVTNHKALYSFGCPRYFFRLDITSQVDDVPYAFVDWCRYRAKTSTTTYFEGSITENEWLHGPSCNTNLSPFITVDDILPSRFVMAYEDDTFDIIAFLSLDPERLGDNVDDGIITDFGDNVLSGKVSAMREFLSNPNL